MPDENVNKWKQKGHLYLWYYVENTRNYPDWNLTADEDFRDSFVELIQKMSQAQYNSQKSLRITSPTTEVLKVPNNRGGQAKWKSPETLILKHQKAETVDDSFIFDESENKIILTIGWEKLELLKECFLNIRKEIDYSVEIGNAQIWFW